MVNRVPREVSSPKPEGPPRDLPRDSIHQDTLKAFSHIFILLLSRACKEGLLSANGVPRGSIGRVKSQYASSGCRNNGHSDCFMNTGINKTEKRKEKTGER